MTQKVTQQLRAEDFGDAKDLRRALNDLLADVQGRIATLEALAGLVVLEPLQLKTGASTAPGSAPFPVRVGIPSNVTPAGVFCVGVRNLTTNGVAGLASVAHDVKWESAEGGRAFRLLHVPGLQANKTYEMRLVVLRA